MTRLITSARAIAAIVVAALAIQRPLAREPLTLVRTIDLPSVDGRIDHLAFDKETQRLYVAALGNNTVEVIDARAGADVASLPGFHEPQGVAVAADAKVIAVANGEGVGVQLLAEANLRAGATIRLGDDSDNVRYDSSAQRLFVGFGDGALAAIALSDGKVLAEARVPGHPESFQIERPGPRIFVNVPASDEIAVVDRTSMKVAATWRLTMAQANYPMAFDEANHRLFIGCRRPAKTVVVDTATGKEITSFDIVGDTDDLFYDADLKRLYVSGGDGYLDVVEDQGGNRFVRIARVATPSGARTSLFVPDDHRLYLAVPRRGAQRSEIRVYEAR